ncbi:MAG: molybdenum cofactor biosysynthesis protein [Verrucomicrobiota bacterium]
MKVSRIFISPEHNYVGHYGKRAGTHPIIEVDEIECVAGSGIKGDRYFDHKPDFKGQITFFEQETHDRLCEEFGIFDKGPESYRRNVIVEGQNLNELIKQEFEIQGVRFVGTEEAKPCFWMNEALCPGAEQFLKGKGGLRARILTDGVLKNSLSFT